MILRVCIVRMDSSGKLSKIVRAIYVIKIISENHATANYSKLR